MKKLLLFLSTISIIALADDIPFCYEDSAPITYINVAPSVEMLNFRDGYGIAVTKSGVYDSNSLYFFKDGVQVKKIPMPVAGQIRGVTVGIDPQGNYVAYVAFTHEINKYNFNPKDNSSTVLDKSDTLLGSSDEYSSIAYDDNRLIVGTSNSADNTNYPRVYVYLWRNEVLTNDALQSDFSRYTANEFKEVKINGLALDGNSLFYNMYQFTSKQTQATWINGVMFSDVAGWSNNESLKITMAEKYSQNLPAEHGFDASDKKYGFSVNHSHHIVAAGIDGSLWYYNDRDSSGTKLNDGKSWQVSDLSLQDNNILYFTVQDSGHFSNSTIYQCKIPGVSPANVAGSWAQSCKNASYDPSTTTLTATCGYNGNDKTTSIVVNGCGGQKQVMNRTGNLMCETDDKPNTDDRPQIPGSWVYSCEFAKYDPISTKLEALCAEASGTDPISILVNSCASGRVKNAHGNLKCE